MFASPSPPLFPCHKYRQQWLLLSNAFTPRTPKPQTPNPETLTSKLPSTTPQAANRTPQAPARRYILTCISIINTAIDVDPTPPLPLPPALRVFVLPPPFPSRWLASCCVVMEWLLLRLLACSSVAFIGIAPERQ